MRLRLVRVTVGWVRGCEVFIVLRFKVVPVTAIILVQVSSWWRLIDPSCGPLGLDAPLEKFDPMLAVEATVV